MGVIVIYATILLNGMVNVIQYKADTFKTNESIYKSLKFAQKLIEKILGFKISNYS